MKLRHFAVAVLAIVALPDPLVYAAINFQTVALSSQTAPGVGAGVTFNSFQFPAINEGGVVTFDAQVQLPNHSDREGIWTGPAGALQLVAYQDIQPPGVASGVRYQDFFYPSAVSNSSQVAFTATITGPGITADNNTGVWAGSAGALQLLALAGAQAAGMPVGVTYQYLMQPTAINSSGKVVFSGGLSGPGVVLFQSDTAVWAGDAAAPQVLLRTGSAAPGTAPGVVFADPGGGYHPGINPAGNVVIKAGLSGPGVSAVNDLGIWVGLPGALQLVAREGDPAPGTGAGVVFSEFAYPPFLLQGLNGAGQIGFRALLGGPGVNGTNSSGLWIGPPGGLSLVAHEASPAPGLGTGVLFGDMLTDPMINRLGQVIFQSGLTGAGVNTANNAAIWAGMSGALHVVARRGMQAPGTAGGVTFDSDAGVDTPFFSTVLSPTGQVAFMSVLFGAGVNSTNLHGIWATDPAGNLQLIAREGQPFNIGGGDIRTIMSLSLTPSDLSSGAEDGRAHVFNSSGQLVFFAEFTDFTSGIFIATVPEPSAVQLLAAGLLIILIFLRGTVQKRFGKIDRAV
jgi:hypothetical protein